MIKQWKRWRAGRIENKEQREKALATLDNKPWVKVLDVEFADPSHPSIGSMELDWNEQFIEMLKENGYSGRNAEDIVDMWFRDLCRGVIDDTDKS
jgi:hypothetical protein